MQDKVCSRQYAVASKIAHCSLLIAHCLLLTAVAFAENVQTLDLQQLINEALKNNPDLFAAISRANAFKKEGSQMGALEDPRIEIGLLKVPMNTLSLSAPMKEITVMQSLPYPGKLSLKSEMARIEAEAAEEEYKDIEIKLIQMVKEAYYDLYFVYKSIEITEKNKITLKDFVNVAEAKYAVGKGLQQDVLKAQVGLSRTIDELIRLEKERQSAEARINVLMNRLPQSPLGKPKDIKMTSFNFTIEELQSAAEENRPLLKGLKRMIERYRAAYNLAKLDYYPDFDVGLSVGQEGDSMNYLSGKISMNIPLWYKTKQDRKVAEKSNNVNSLTNRYNAAKNEFLHILIPRQPFYPVLSYTRVVYSLKSCL